MTATKAKPHQHWESRIVAESTVPARDLTPHPLNWRTHPQPQQDAMADVLEQVGWVQRVIVNRTTGHILDGHLRVEMAAARGENVPVVWVEVSEEEERLVLATMDPLGAMAGKDAEALAELIADLDLPDSLADLLNPPDGPDPIAEWQGMPAIEAEDKTAYRDLIVHFVDEEAVESFKRALGIDFSSGAKYITFPFEEEDVTAHLRVKQVE